MATMLLLRGRRAPLALTPATSLVRRSASALALPPEIHRRVREQPLGATYEPAAVETGWHAYWQRAIAHKKQQPPGDAPHFSMLLPPPNVTGALHIGHALTITIQDALARWHHMRGFNVRWVPGLDHAGIATQSVVERKLAQEEGRSRHDLGRDAFLERVWQWNEQYGGRILHQIDQLGAVVNKDESFFTLDEQRSKAVIEAFVQLHERGLVFRKRRMVNWCPTLKTAISDIEVDSESLTGATLKKLPGRSKPVEFGVMHRILYKLADSDDYLQVDTTRPETIFGDVAVAIHPEDPRYTRFHGKHVVHPFSGALLPIVVDDELVNMELGTGVVKVTPAHDPKDYECGLRHGLPEPVVINDSGLMCGDIDEEYIGLDRFEAREAVVAELMKRQLYVEKIDHPTTLSLCSRSGDVIEPLLMPQWFVDCRGMAKRAVDHVRNGELAIEPRTHEHMWYFFLENIQDWCVSRQLWWGHRIPAYRVHLSGHDDEWIVARSMEEAREKVQAKFGAAGANVRLEQDSDVLDTWFSSGLLPVSVFGWPDGDPAQSPAYPISVMETGSDILFFWVARMAMLCEEFSGKTPFERILLHPMVRDKAGRKMSKSLGNVIDPIHVIQGITLDELLAGLQAGNVSEQERKKAEKELRREFPKGIQECGTDALRYALASYLQQGRQINMDLQRVISHRQFCNKIWNAVRYALPLLEDEDSAKNMSAQSLDGLRLSGNMSLADRWILSRLASTVDTVNKSMRTNQLAGSVSSFQRFFIQELCDVYIEFSKPILYGNRVSAEDFGGSEQEFRDHQLAARMTLFTCLDYSMRLLHPFAPFVTEELWQRIRTYDPSMCSEVPDAALLFAQYPEREHVEPWIDGSAEKDMELVLDVLHSIRSLRHTVKTLAPTGSSQTDDIVVKVSCGDPTDISVLRGALRDLESQSRLRIEVEEAQNAVTDTVTLSHSISQTCKVLFPVPDDPDTPQRVRMEIERLSKRAIKMKESLEGVVKRQRATGYATKVPESVQQQDSARVTQLETELQTTHASIEVLIELEQQY